jgi:hypothetical protein
MKTILDINNIIFAGIYSDKYQRSYNNLYQFLSQYFPTNNIIYTKIDQKIFDNYINYDKNKCYWCQQHICKFVFHQGETCKIENQIQIYEKFLNTSYIIIYTDCDIIFNNTIIEELTSIINHNNYNNIDIFYREEKNKNRWRAGINIGLTLSRSTDDILKFYKEVLQFMKNNKYPHTWDQQVINNMFANKTTILKYGILPNHLLCKHRFAGGNG